MHDAHAAHSHAIPAHHPHISPLKTYLTVYFALLGLTIVTVIVSYLNLGAVGLAAALVVAIVKATVVGMYFMHLKYDDRFNTIIVFASILFILLFFGLTFADLQSRGMISEEEDNHYMRRVKQAQALADKLQAQGAAPPAVAPAAVGHQPDAAPAGSAQPARPGSGAGHEPGAAVMPAPGVETPGQGAPPAAPAPNPDAPETAGAPGVPESKDEN